MNINLINSNIRQKSQVQTFRAANTESLDDLVNGFLIDLFKNEKTSFNVQDIKYWDVPGLHCATVIYYSTYQLTSSDPT